MMSKRMKVISMLMATAMLATACGQTEVQSTVESESNSNTDSIKETEVKSLFNETGYPIVNEEVTIKILAKTPTQGVSWTDMAEAPAWQYISELTGIKFEFETYAEQEMATKLPLIMSDPESLPDIFWQCGMTETDMLNYAEQGLILDLDEYIDKYGENIKKCWDSNPVYKGYATSVDGNVYMLPSYNDAGVVEIRNFIVNTRWMENCGIESMPTNLDEFKDMLIKFRDMDANGNG